MDGEGAENTVVILLTQTDVQRVKETIMDRDTEAALALLRDVVNPQIEKRYEKGHLKPFFES